MPSSLLDPPMHRFAVTLCRRTDSAIHKAAGSLVTGCSLQNGKKCCQQE